MDNKNDDKACQTSIMQNEINKVEIQPLSNIELLRIKEKYPVKQNELKQIPERQVIQDLCFEVKRLQDALREINSYPHGAHHDKKVARKALGIEERSWN
jgi:succinate dehydrogenase/fumarate reductase-like Fe-S protein